MKKFVVLFLFLSSICWGCDDSLELLISPEEIEQRMVEIGAKIDADYQDREITLLMVMKGAVCTAADLMRHIHVPVKIEYMKASSYGQNGTHRGELKLTGVEHLDFTGKDILVVDDIFDTGNTMTRIVEELEKRNPQSVKTAVLLVKNVSRTTDYRPDYVFFDIENRFVIGYGLDYKEYYRELPGVYAFINDTPPSEE